MKFSGDSTQILLRKRPVLIADQNGWVTGERFTQGFLRDFCCSLATTGLFQSAYSWPSRHYRGHPRLASSPPKSLHVYESTPWPSVLLRVHLLSTFGPHRWRGGRRDWVRQARLEWRARLFESEVLETSCLIERLHFHDIERQRNRVLLLRTSRQILPNLSIFG
jgi:hypothetical protein